jgi:hypothetical protein
MTEVPVTHCNYRSYANIREHLRGAPAIRAFRRSQGDLPSTAKARRQECQNKQSDQHDKCPWTGARINGISKDASSDGAGSRNAAEEIPAQSENRCHSESTEIERGHPHLFFLETWQVVFGPIPCPTPCPSEMP